MKIAVIGAGVSGLTLNQGGSSLSQKLQSEKAAWTYFMGPDGFLYEIWQREMKTGIT